MSHNQKLYSYGPTNTGVVDSDLTMTIKSGFILTPRVEQITIVESSDLYYGSSDSQEPYMDQVKYKLAVKLAEHIIESKKAVFVRSEDRIRGEMSYKVQFCLLDADQVRKMKI